MMRRMETEGGDVVSTGSRQQMMIHELNGLFTVFLELWKQKKTLCILIFKENRHKLRLDLNLYA